MTNKHTISQSDILSMADYGAIRANRRKSISELKRDRRVSVGPFATFYFENYETMWMQVHEMLFVEQGGDEQIAGELEAYNPLIPKGRELIATLMFEIADAGQRAYELSRLGKVEDMICLELDNESIPAISLSDDIDRTNDAGKTSAVHFLRFSLSDAAAESFKNPAIRASISISHPNYGHTAIIQEITRNVLCNDLD